jgi:hypothetical protein
MHDGDLGVVSGLGTRGCGVRVALDQNRRWWLLREESPETLDHPADLGVSRLPADPIQDLRRRKARGLKEDAGKFGIGVLASMQETGIVSQHPHNRAKFNHCLRSVRERVRADAPRGDSVFALAAYRVI